MQMDPPKRATVAGLYRKAGKGFPMVMLEQVALERQFGPPGTTANPRQVCIALASSLSTCCVPPAGARADLVINDPALWTLDPGDELRAGGATLRVTLSCEPCSHGAKLAGVGMAQFRALRRLLAYVTKPGVVAVGDPVRARRGVFERAPDSFPSRCDWAVRQIPAGHYVTSVGLLYAIGATPSYLRVLPSWMKRAFTKDAPVHRVLTARREAPSWATDALSVLNHEAAQRWDVVKPFPLCDSLWLAVD